MNRRRKRPVRNSSSNSYYDWNQISVPVWLNLDIRFYNYENIEDFEDKVSEFRSKLDMVCVQDLHSNYMYLDCVEEEIHKMFKHFCKTGKILRVTKRLVEPEKKIEVVRKTDG